MGSLPVWLVMFAYILLGWIQLVAVVASVRGGSPATRAKLSQQISGGEYPMSQHASSPSENEVSQHFVHWNTPPSVDSAANLVFNSISGLLQHWHNTRYRNGHTVVPAAISPGTTLYHAKNTPDPPQANDWLSFDFDHSYWFCQVDCYMLTYVAIKPLKVLYFDGSSAAKMDGGPIDSQDIIFEGKVVPGSWKLELFRVDRMCEWAQQFGLDGFIRMEFDFELIYCNFTEGLQLTSNLRLINSRVPRVTRPATPHHTEIPPQAPVARFHPKGSLLNPSRSTAPLPTLTPIIPLPVLDPPPTGWVGSLRAGKSLDFEAIQAGSWHNFAPGINGIEVDYSRLITFFDPRYPSLIEGRRGLTPEEYRLLNISQEDAVLFKNDLENVLTRTGEGSGVNWGAITRGIIERHAQRLEFLGYILNSTTEGFEPIATTVARRARQHVMMMLTPYLLRSALPHTPSSSGSNIPSPLERWSNTTWLSEPMRLCSTLFMPPALLARTSQEEVIRTAIERTLHEICRTLGVIWVDAFVVEKVDNIEAQVLIKKWKEAVDGLVKWLDWSIWRRCKPGCGPEYLCTLPQWPFDGLRSPREFPDMTPRCTPREYAAEMK